MSDISFRRSTTITLAQAAVALAGLNYTFAGLALLVAPAWFYETIGRFPPFNRHYMGDVGAFLLPLGLGLLIAARDPSRYMTLIRVTVAGSVLHLLNHLYDAWAGQEPLGHWLVDLVPLALMALLLIAGNWRLLGPQPRRGGEERNA